MADPPTIIELESDDSRYLVVAIQDQRASPTTTVGLLIHIAKDRIWVHADKLARKTDGDGWEPLGKSWRIGSQSIEPGELGEGWRSDLSSR